MKKNNFEELCIYIRAKNDPILGGAPISGHPAFMKFSRFLTNFKLKSWLHQVLNTMQRPQRIASQKSRDLISSVSKVDRRKFLSQVPQAKALSQVPQAQPKPTGSLPRTSGWVSATQGCVTHPEGEQPTCT